MPTIRVVAYRSGHGRNSGEPRRAAVQAWLDTLTAEQRRELVAALVHSENAAGDKLAAWGKPRTWRKNLRVVP